MNKGKFVYYLIGIFYSAKSFLFVKFYKDYFFEKICLSTQKIIFQQPNVERNNRQKIEQVFIHVLITKGLACSVFYAFSTVCYYFNLHYFCRPF